MDPGTSKKPLFARKTMPPSSRKQMEMLKRKAHKPERIASSGSSDERPNHLGVNTTEEFLSAGALQDLLQQLYMDSYSEPEVPVEVRLDVVLLSSSPRPQATAAKDSNEQDRREPLLDDESHAEEHDIPLTSQVTSHPHQETTRSPVQPDNAPRKRRMSERDEAAPSKRMKASDRAVTDGSTTPEDRVVKIKPMIHNYLSVAMGTLDQKLQHLNGRIDHIQCQQKHERIIIKSVKRVSKLDRRVNGVIAVQKAEMSQKAKLPGSDSANMILNCPRSLPVQTNNQSLPTNTTDGKDLPGASKSLTSSNASPQEDESSDDVVCIDAENHHPSMPVAKVPDVQQNKEAEDVADASFQAPTQSMLVIDLTEEQSTTETALGKEEEKTTSSKAKPASEALNTEAFPLQELSSKEVLMEVLLPPLPKIRILPETVTDFKGTLPPQKLELSVANLLNPKGVALGFHVSNVDTRCAHLESIHVFFFVLNTNTKTTFQWTPLKTIEARPLPMFISLGDLPMTGTYYFTVQSKDIYGRYGPFCDIRVISVT